MNLRLIPLSTERFPSWLERSQAEYESDLTASGEAPHDAREHAATSMVDAFPTGSPTPDNAVFDVVDDDGSTVGYLWVGRDNSGEASSWWIWDILVESEQRGKGLGRATMKLAEEYARSQGARTLGLSVFGFNDAARGLYESLGYETTTVKMRKAL